MDKYDHLPVIDEEIEDKVGYLESEVLDAICFDMMPNGLTPETLLEWLTTTEEVDYMYGTPIFPKMEMRPVEVETTVVDKVRVAVADHSEFFGRDEICKTRLVLKRTHLRATKTDLEMAISNLLKQANEIRLNDDGYVEVVSNSSGSYLGGNNSLTNHDGFRI